MSKNKQPPAEEVVEDPAKPHSCPFCKYRAKTPSLLSRHINHHHPELKQNTPAGLLGILKEKASVPEILGAVAGWIETDTSFDKHLPDDVITYLRREDAKTQLILRVIAIDKIQRALDLSDRIKKMEALFDDKLTDVEFQANATPSSYLALIERMQELQSKELGFLKEITQLGQIDLNDVIDKLVGAFGSAKLGSKPASKVSAFQLTGVTGLEGLDDLTDPGERETVRKLITRIVATDDNGSGKGNITIEADAEEGSSAASE